MFYPIIANDDYEPYIFELGVTPYYLSILDLLILFCMSTVSLTSKETGEILQVNSKHVTLIYDQVCMKLTQREDNHNLRFQELEERSFLTFYSDYYHATKESSFKSVLAVKEFAFVVDYFNGFSKTITILNSETRKKGLFGFLFSGLPEKQQAALLDTIEKPGGSSSAELKQQIYLENEKVLQLIRGCIKTTDIPLDRFCKIIRAYFLEYYAYHLIHEDKNCTAYLPPYPAFCNYLKTWYAKDCREHHIKLDVLPFPSTTSIQQI